MKHSVSRSLSLTPKVFVLCVVVLSACSLRFDLEPKTSCRSDSDCAPTLLCLGAAPNQDGVCQTRSSTSISPDVLEDTEEDTTQTDTEHDVSEEDVPSTDVLEDIDASPDDTGCPIECVPGERFCASEEVAAQCVLGADGCPQADPDTRVFCSGEQLCARGQCADNDQCVDQDNDGHGVDCALGADCDDTNANIHSSFEELCDGVDHDCDGAATNGFDLTTDPNNCGRCGVECGGNNAVWNCVESQCRIVSCEGGFFDANSNPDDGCEYACIPNSVTEAICTDGIDNDCNGLTDDTDPVCTENAGLAGQYTGLYMTREDLTGPGGPEATMLLTLLNTSFNDTNALQERGWEASPVLPNAGRAIARNRLKRVESLGERRFLLSPDPDNTADTRTWSVFPSRDASRSLLIGSLQGEDTNSAWSDGMVLFARSDNAQAGAAFRPPYTQGMFRARTLANDNRALANQSTWRALYEPIGASTRLLSEVGETGNVPGDVAYPFGITIEESQANTVSIFRGAPDLWDTTSVGYTFLDGRGVLTALFSSEECTNQALRNETCPPEAGWSVFVHPPSVGLDLGDLQGRWVLVGVKLEDAPGNGGVRGTPFFLGAEMEITSSGALVGSGASAWAADLGTCVVDGSTVSLNLRGLTGGNNNEPEALTLSGALSEGGDFAVLFEGINSTFEPGLYILMRL